MHLPQHIFRAYDIRGSVEDELTPDVVQAIGQAFGSMCLDQGISQVVTARDTRLSGPVLLEALNAGILASGCDVIDIGTTTTPMLYFATYHLQTRTGAMLTGSHNPPQYNGLKMLIDGHTLLGDQVGEIYQRLCQGKLHSGSGSYSQQDIRLAYLDRILSKHQLARPLRVGIDCGNGAASVIASDLMRMLGCQISELYCTPDGNFPNHHPDPSQPENLRDLIDLVVRQQLDIGLAFDGDGDRLNVVDNRGEILWPDRQLILLAQDILKRHPGSCILYDVKCSSLVPKMIAEAGGTPQMCRTGHSYVKSQMQQTGALLGGEMSGHLFFKEHWYGFDDGLYAAVRLLEVLGAQTLSAAQLFATIPATIATPELNIALEEGQSGDFMRRFVELMDFPEGEITRLDGVRVDFADGWGLVRASNTTPSLVLRFEGETQLALDRIQRQFGAIIAAANPALIGQLAFIELVE